MTEVVPFRSLSCLILDRASKSFELSGSAVETRGLTSNLDLTIAAGKISALSVDLGSGNSWTNSALSLASPVSGDRTVTFDHLDLGKGQSGGGDLSIDGTLTCTDGTFAGSTSASGAAGSAAALGSGVAGSGGTVTYSGSASGTLLASQVLCSTEDDGFSITASAPEAKVLLSVEASASDSVVSLITDDEHTWMLNSQDKLPFTRTGSTVTLDHVSLPGLGKAGAVVVTGTLSCTEGSLP